MTPTRDLLHRSAATFWTYPSTWIPAVGSGAAGYIFAFLCDRLRRPMIYALSPKSVLGGVTVQMNAKVLFFGFLLQWLPMLLEVTAFVYALGVTSRLVGKLAQHQQHKLEWDIPLGFRTTLLRTLFAGLVVLGLFVCSTVIVSKFWRPNHGNELAAALFLVVGCPVSWLIVPAWLHYCADNQPDLPLERSRVPAWVGFTLGAAGSLALDMLLSRITSQVFSDLHASSLLPSFTLNLIRACLGQLATAFGFIALALPSSSFHELVE